MTADIPRLLHWRGRLAVRRWRGLVWLTAEMSANRHRALELWQRGPWQSPCWVSPVCPPELASATAGWLAPAKAQTRLGGEHDLVVFDSGEHGLDFDADAFGALTGTLRAGGLAVLLTPPHWGTAPDGEPQFRYLVRLARLLLESNDVAHWPAAEPLRCPPLPEGAMPAARPSDDPDCLTADQAEAVARLTRLRRRRPLVLTADRGRGKSAALGIACARLLAGGERRIHVTAPRPAAVAALFERLEQLCPAGRREGTLFTDAQGGRVLFMAPDELVAHVERGEAGGPGSVLLVDEAAAIPAALLGQWLSAFPRIAFATTLHGYEGSGRGFALRFRERLDRQTPDWRTYHLAAPVRWAAGDPLERLVATLLMLDAEPPPAALTREPTTLRRWRRDELAGDEARLRAIFGLLIQAHYRTTPADLRRLLDEPALRVVTLEAQGATQAVVVCGDEGGVDAELAERVARGERRPPGHLLAQSLAAHAGSREALMSRVRRVQRIAVHPGRRREGLGRRLLEAELAEARAAGIDLLGASFGAEAALIDFWRSLRFRAVRLGLSRETATGEHALMVVAPTSVRGVDLMAQLGARFARLLPALLAFELRELAPDVALRLLADSDAPRLDDADRRDCADVAFGRREPATARPALQALLRHSLSTRGGAEGVELAWLVAWAFQGRDTAWLAARLGVPGKKAVVAHLRRGVAGLIEATSAD